MTSLVDKIVAIHRSLEKGRVPHAFGGALALAWCTQNADAVIAVLSTYLGPDDERIDRLRALA